MVQGAQSGSQPSYTPPPVSQRPQDLGAVESYDWLNSVGINLSIGGSLLNVAGTYYGLKAQQGALKAESQNAEFAANQANIAARGAEREASDIIYMGQQVAAWRGAQEAMDVASLRARTAAGGVQVGTGSAAQVERAARLAAELDKRAVRTNSERRAAASREAAANARAGATLGRATAANLRDSASSVNPVAGAAGTALSGAGNVIGQYMAYSGRR